MKTTENTNSWTPERVSELTKLWADGLSSSHIAKHMGEVTRNAVMGKVCRLGLPLRGRAAVNESVRLKPRGIRTLPPPIKAKRQKSATPAGAPAMPQARPNMLAGFNMARRLASPALPLPQPRGGAIATQPRPWLTRKFAECAYPVSGEGADTLSCCNAIDAPSGAYCPAHRKLMFAKPATAAQRAAAAHAREARSTVSRVTRRRAA